MKKITETYFYLDGECKYYLFLIEFWIELFNEKYEAND